MALHHSAWWARTAWTALSLQLCTSSAGSISASQFTDQVTQNFPAFDYVIVGSGPGGLVMANRLTEDENIQVAIIEAGTWSEDVVGNTSQVPGYNLVYDAPSASSPQLGNDWGFLTTPQAGLNGVQTRYQRGKCLGGSTNLNAMAWSISSVGAFDTWAETVGDSSWAFETVQKYYHKAMNFAPLDSTRIANATPEFRKEDAVRKGPLDIRYPAYAYSWTTWLAVGLDAIGIKQTNSFIDGKLNGSAWQTNTINHTTSERVSADTAYLRPFLQRPNLHVFQQTLAEKILFDKHKSATGVQTIPVNGTSSTTLHAKREVIVSAGAFQSPQLLQVSGVGPRAVLESHNISVIADRPGVGKNLNDQFFFGIAYHVDVPAPVTIGSSQEAVAAAAQFNQDGTGPLSNPGGEYAGFEKLPAHLRGGFSERTNQTLAQLPADWPEIEFLTLPAFIGNGRTTPAANGSFGTILAAIQTATSRGNVSISSGSMHDPPIINPAWLTTREDVEVSIAMFKRVREVWTASPMRNVTIGNEYFPGNSVQTDAEIEAFLHDNIMPIYHASATNKMGKASDPNAVVDSEGRVFGVNRLRVADVSAFPFLFPGTAPQAGVYMLSEKLADAVKADQK